MGAVGAPVPPKPRFRPFTGFGCVENDVENAAEGAALPIPRPPLLVSADVLPAPPNPKLGVQAQDLVDVIHLRGCLVVQAYSYTQGLM